MSRWQSSNHMQNTHYDRKSQISSQIEMILFQNCKSHHYPSPSLSQSGQHAGLNIVLLSLCVWLLSSFFFFMLKLSCAFLDWCSFLCFLFILYLFVCLFFLLLLCKGWIINFKGLDDLVLYFSVDAEVFGCVKT